MAETKHERIKTRITRMEMKGFKSFANKTQILFQDGFNCILGPNGSGKSNVLDSLCFVLGKSGSKSLRAEKTANLIYNGGKLKKPAKQGEVHIYFDNSSGVFPVQEEEVKISRIVKPSGSSTYKINDETVTRTQIIDLLSHAKINPDGYNIILQGDIVRLIEMSSNERRGIIEEISGISIYEDKKAKAARELERVEQQLKEADIVLAERKTYLEELKKERDQALKFRELDEKIKRNKATILLRRLDDKRLLVEKVEVDISKQEEVVGSIQKKIADLKEAVIDKKRLLDEIQREVEEKGEKEQVALMREVENLKVDVAIKEQRLQQLVSELERMSDRRSELEKSLSFANKKVDKINKDISVFQKRIDSRMRDRERIEKKITDFRKKNDLASAADIDSRISDIDKQAESLQDEIRALREEQQSLLREQDRIEYRIQTIDEKISKVLEAKKSNKKQLDKLKKLQSELNTVKSRLSSALDRSSAIVPELNTAKGKLITRQEQYNKLKSRQAQIAERAAGSRAVSEVLKLRAKNKKIYGTVAELGRVDKKYSLALEIAAGSRIKSVVVEDDKTAHDCIRYLKEQRLGVATFLPLNKLRSRPVPAEVRSVKGSGVHGLAVDFVSFDSKFNVVFSYVFGSTLIVEDVATARKVGVGKTRMVTLDGDVIETTGAMSGGFRSRSAGSGLGFQEKELSSELIRLESELSDLNAVISRLSDEQSELSALIDNLRAERHEIEDQVLSLERELHINSGDIDTSKSDRERLRAEAGELSSKIDSLITEISVKNKSLAALKIEKSKLREKITRLRSPQALAELNAFQQQREKLSEEIAQIKAQSEGLRNQINNIYIPEIDNIKKILLQQDKEQQEFLKEQHTIKNSLKQLRIALKDKEQKQEAFRKQFKNLFDKRSKLESEKDSLENKIISLEEKLLSAQNKLNAFRIQLAQYKAEYAGLSEEAKEFEGIEPFKTKKQDVIEREIKEFKKMVDRMGAVNMKALEVYERVEKEFDSLISKKKVLDSEREDVLLMINEIDAKKRDMFMITYDKIQEHFKSIFNRLSSKGDAFLELETPDDPFAGGLDIRVRLKGNKFMDIRSLSGGEKTMTALAFLFAVQEYEPAMFYILDEVDAALDKKNSERLAKLIRSYSDDAQYIIISHNDTIISEADTLFGVSMNENGESQITSLQI